METLWYWLVAVMVTLYVVFDGFDLGAGALHLWVARGDRERRLVIRSIGPIWDGNEVWLLASGGMLLFAFPPLFASAFSGFYLPLTIVVWLLLLRGISIEFRNHLENALWCSFFDAVFALASLLLAVFFGAALGNVVRGVAFDGEGRFFAPLWTHFGVTGEVGILDWYTVPVGVAALAALVHHGALWLVLKAEGELALRARRAARGAWWAVLAMTALVTALSWIVQPMIADNLAARPWAWTFPALALAGLFASRWMLARGHELAAFLASVGYLVGMLTSAAAGIYPYLLPSTTEAERGYTAAESVTGLYAQQVALAWWIPGMALVAAYFVFTYRHFAGKVTLEGEGY